MSLKYKIFKIKKRFMKNYTSEDLKPGVKIEWLCGVSTIKEVTKWMCQTIYTGEEELNMHEETAYILDTNYIFADEIDQIDEDWILRIVK